MVRTRVLASTLLWLVAVGCGSGTLDPSGPEDPGPAGLRITPDPIRLERIGSAATYTVLQVDPEGRSLGPSHGHTVVVGDSSVAAEVGGVVTALRNGVTYLAVRSEVGADTVSVIVVDPTSVGPILGTAYRRGVFDEQLVILSQPGTDPKPISRPAGSVTQASMSPDGTRVAYTYVPRVWDGRTSELWIANTDGSGDHPLLYQPGRRHSMYIPTWLPDGDSLLVSPWMGDIRMVSTTTGGWRRIHSDSAAFASDGGRPILSPSGRTIAFANLGSIEGGVKTWTLFVIGRDGQGLTRLTEETGGARILSVTWSPDEDRVIFFTRRSAHRPDGYYSVRIDDGQVSPVLQGWQTQAREEPALSQRGTKLFDIGWSGSISARVIELDLRTSAVTAIPIHDSHNGDLADFLVPTEDGHRIAFVRYPRDSSGEVIDTLSGVYWSDRTGANEEPLIIWSDWVFYPLAWVR